MTQSARTKLNALHLGGSIFVAGVVATLTSSWVLFLLVLAALVMASFFTGQVRVSSSRK